jgi:hypothetical protein
MNGNELLVVVRNLPVSEQKAVEAFLQNEFGNGSVSWKFGDIFILLPERLQFLARVTSLESYRVADYEYLLQRLQVFTNSQSGTLSKLPRLVTQLQGGKIEFR